MPTVFLDRDGVINENRSDHVKSWDEFVFVPGALAALKRLHHAGWQTIVVTNQAIIHRRAVPQATVDAIHERLMQTVAQHGGYIEAVFCCPHDPAEGCDCRKPQPGLLLQAAAQFSLRLDRCYLIGDALTDMAAGQAVGCRCTLVRTGRGRSQGHGAAGHYGHYRVATDLGAAVHWMLLAERARANRDLVRVPAPRVTTRPPAPLLLSVSSWLEKAG